MTIETGWQERTLGDLCSLRRELMEPTSTGAHRYIGLEHIDPGLPSLRRWGTDRHLKSTKSRFYAGDMLYGKLRPYLDKAAVAEWEGVCSTDILTLQPHKDEADSQYIGFLLHTSAFLSYAVATTSGVNHPRTSWADIARFSYPVPPVQEQRTIAGVLSKILAAVELQEQFVAAFKELKAATMAKVFREGLRGEPLKQTEIGEIPQSWNVIDMGSVCKKINYGTSVRCTGERNGRPVLRIPNIINEGIDESELKWAALPDNEVPKLLLQPGDLLFVRTNGNKEYLGRCAVYEDQPQGALFASYLIRVRLAQEAVLPAFVQAYLSSVGREQITRRAHAASDGKYNIDTGVLREVLLPVPQLGEQHAIVGLLRTVERRLAAARDQVRQAKSLFSSMLHLLMTGRLRVTPKMIALQRVADRERQRKAHTGTVDEKLLKEIVRRIVEAVAPEKIILFGSAARGEMGPDSDLDLLIVKSDVHRLATAQMIEHSLIGITIPTDIVVATPKDIEMHKDTIGLIYRPALQEGKILYAA